MRRQGLGLAIAAKTAELLAHRLVMRSRLGRGSMFAVEVPRAEKPAATITHTSAPQPRAPTDCGVQATILLIEDDPLQASGLETMLVAQGHRVVVAQDLASALAALPTPLHLILSDYRLAGPSGIESVQAIRAAAAEVIPAIILTGDTHTKITAEASRDGCKIIHKPCAAKRLLDTIAAVIATPSGAP